MKKEPENDRCLSDAEIESLAIRLIAQRRGISQGEGRAAETPDGLSMSLDEAARAHLEQCNACRRKWMSESRIYRAYLEAVDTSKADLAIRQRIESDLRESLRGRRCKLLFFCPDESDAGEELALAAATEGTGEAPLMFAEREDDGDLIFKRESDPATGAEVCYLVGSDPAFTKNAEVLIDGEIYRSNEKGIVDLGGKRIDPSGYSIIVVLPSR